MKKVLFTATVDSHILQFHIPFLKYFKENGYEIHVATNGNEEIPYCDKKIVIPFERSPYKINNLKAIKQLKKVIMDEKYDIIHTHTPMGSVVTRLAAKKARKKYNTRVIYTAHGFHFYKGAPKKNWILFYPVEKYISKYTDKIITINNEDYELAKKKFKCNVEYVPGVGIDENKFNIKMSKEEKRKLRKSLGLKDDDFVMIYPAEISERKRHLWLINTLKDLLTNHNNIHLLLPGRDSLYGKCNELVDNLKLTNQVHFLGYRKDVPQLMRISDLAISSARQEGLPVNIMEAMYVGLPIVASNCRGNRDLVINNKNGYLIDIENENEFNKAILKVYNNSSEISKFKEYSKKLIDNFMLDKVMLQMKKIYGIENKKLSIIIPVYNLENYISKTLNSIVEQNINFSNIEVIIIDDGSVDNTKKICDEYVNKYSFIKYYYQDNSGVSDARNKGLSVSTGDYIYFVDGDDILLNNSLEYIMKNIKSNYDIIQFDFVKFINDNDSFKLNEKYNKRIKKINNSSYPYNLEFLFKYNNYNLSLWANVINKSLIKNKRLNPNLKYTQDMDFLLDNLLECKNILISPKKIYGYRQNRAESATMKIDNKRIDDMIYFINKWHDKLNYSNLCYKKNLLSFVSYQYLICLGLCYIINDNDKLIELKEKIDLLNYNKLLKVKVGKIIYKLFGYNFLVKTMGTYLKIKNK